MEKLETGIGDKEMEKLEPKVVKIIDVKVSLVKNKKEEEVGDKASFTCKHPDQDDTIDISKVKYLKADKLKVSATWYNEDSDKKIVKGSALAQLLMHLKVPNLKSVIGKDNVETVSDESGYLCFKAY